MDLNLGLIASGQGSNFKAIVENIEKKILIARPMILITNNPDAGVIKVARDHHIPSKILNDKHHEPYSSLDEAILKELIKSSVNLVVLAGYMKQIGNAVLDHYHNRVLNIHPAIDLVRYGGKGMYGMNVHDAVIRSGDDESGATVHLADEIYDHGRILGREKVPVFPSDTSEDLAARVLKVEHKIYTDVLIGIQQGRILLNQSIPNP